MHTLHFLLQLLSLHSPQLVATVSLPSLHGTAHALSDIVGRQHALSVLILLSFARQEPLESGESPLSCLGILPSEQKVHQHAPRYSPVLGQGCLNTTDLEFALKELTGVAPCQRTLRRTLVSLQSARLIKRYQKQVKPVRCHYELTAQGVNFCGLLLLLLKCDPVQSLTKDK